MPTLDVPLDKLITREELPVFLKALEVQGLEYRNVERLDGRFRLEVRANGGDWRNLTPFEAEMALAITWAYHQPQPQPRRKRREAERMARKAAKKGGHVLSA